MEIAEKDVARRTGLLAKKRQALREEPMAEGANGLVTTRPTKRPHNQLLSIVNQYRSLVRNGELRVKNPDNSEDDDDTAVASLLKRVQDNISKQEIDITHRNGLLAYSLSATLKRQEQATNDQQAHLTS